MALVRTVQVRVVIEEWEEPDHVSFSFTLENDPVDGHGTYDATIASQDITTVDISFQVAGRGAMSPVWEAMMRPILPRMAQGFTDTLKAAIELGAEPTPADMGLGTTHD